MKRTLLVALCIITLTTLLIVSAGIVKATEEGYERVDFNPHIEPTIDGKWTSDDEWTLNGAVTMIGDDVAFRSVWLMVQSDPETIVTDTFLVEFFSDNTTDAGDYWQMCIDGDQSEGGAPQSGDFRIDIEGHNNLTVYEGNGAGWAVAATPGSLEWADSISASPTNSTPHWILELTFQKQELGAGPLWNFRLAAYDATTTTLAAWPPTPRDEPNRWGVQSYVSEEVPEGFSLGVVVLLSSVALVVGFYFLRKRSRIDKYSVRKLGR
jgi:hypothetical protein